MPSTNARMRRCYAVASSTAVALLLVTSVVSAEPRPPTPVPCRSIGGAKYNCFFYPAGNGLSAGAPVQASDGSVVGYLNQGDNWVICEAVGASVSRGAATNYWWAWTLANDRHWGWVNALYARGGENNGDFGVVPPCKAGHGSPPRAAPPHPAPGHPTPTPAKTPEPCSSIGAGKFNCSFYPPGDGISGGAPVQDPSGRVVGYLNQGTSFVLCQAVGAEVSSGSNRNNHWAYTEANNHRFGWVNGVWAHGGSNDAPYGGGVPTCPVSRGAPPVAAHAPTPVAAKRLSPVFQQARSAAFTADPGSQIVRARLPDDGDTGLVVMRFFIPSSRAALACLKGDGRSFSSNPAFSSLVNGHARSRVVLAWDTLTGDTVFKVEESETLSCNIPGDRYGNGDKLPAVPLRRYGDCGSVVNDPNVDKPRKYQDVYLSPFNGNSVADPTGAEACISVVNSLTNGLLIGAFSVDAEFQIIPRNGMDRIIDPGAPTRLRSPAATGRDSGLASGGYAFMYSGQGYPAIEAYYYPRYVGEGGPRTLYRRINDPRPPKLNLGVFGIGPSDAGGGDGALTSLADCDKLDVNATHVHCTPYHGIKHMHAWDTDW